jgi:RimJ/RimL family protein N-acetyltransferase
MKARDATIDDCDALGRGMKVVVDEGRWLATELGTAREMTNRFSQAVLNEEHTLLALESGGEVVGALGMHPTGVTGVLSLGMWILPQERGKGGGRMLMAAAMDAVPDGIHKLELEVFPDNEPAIALYRAFGFEQEGVRRDHYRRRDGSLRSAVIMARLLP